MFVSPWIFVVFSAGGLRCSRRNTNLGKWLLDSDIAAATTDGGDLVRDHIESEDIMTALIRFVNGALGVIGDSWCCL